jgi:alpha-L-fucosidase
VETARAVRESGAIVLHGALHSLGDAKAVEVRFEYRSLKGLDANERSGEWTVTPWQRLDAPGAFSARVAAWGAGEPYEFRAAVRHPVLTMYGDAKKVRIQ